MLAAGVVLTGAAGNSLLRVGLSSAAPLALSPLAYLEALARPVVIIGVLGLIANYVFELSLLSWADLTYAMPLTSISYIVITLIGVLGLHEHVSAVHWLGVILILLGVAAVARTRPLTTGTEQQ
jgi:drug/metabolite transporter (DMT)-like permease